jgi:hypothetical protein
MDTNYFSLGVDVGIVVLLFVVASGLVALNVRMNRLRNIKDGIGGSIKELATNAENLRRTTLDTKEQLRRESVALSRQVDEARAVNQEMLQIENSMRNAAERVEAAVRELRGLGAPIPDDLIIRAAPVKTPVAQNIEDVMPKDAREIMERRGMLPEKEVSPQVTSVRPELRATAPTNKGPQVSSYRQAAQRLRAAVTGS